MPAWVFLSAVPYALFTIAGALLWRRTRSAATALVALGFALVLLDQVISVVKYLEVTALLRGDSTDTLFIVQHHAVEQYIALVGLLVAAAGLVWHSVAYPSNRRRGP
jgi:hypothetical protein